MRSDYGLFQRGKHPSPEMRAKMRAGLRRYHAMHPSADKRALDDFIAKVQRLLDEYYERMKKL